MKTRVGGDQQPADGLKVRPLNGNMLLLKRLLYCELVPCYKFKGRRDVRPNLLRFLVRLFDYTCLPNVIVVPAARQCCRMCH